MTDDMSDPLQHQSIYPGGHTEWVDGQTCDECEDARDQARLRHGPPGQWNGKPPEPVAYGNNSMNPKVQEFFETGDPSIFAKPGALDYRPR